MLPRGIVLPRIEAEAVLPRATTCLYLGFGVPPSFCYAYEEGAVQFTLVSGKVSNRATFAVRSRSQVFIHLRKCEYHLAQMKRHFINTRERKHARISDFCHLYDKRILALLNLWMVKVNLTGIESLAMECKYQGGEVTHVPKWHNLISDN